MVALPANIALLEQGVAGHATIHGRVSSMRYRIGGWVRVSPLAAVALVNFALAAFCVAPQMAPEHFRGTMSTASDVYSFGVMLWEMGE